MFETSVVKSEVAVAPRRTGLLAMSLALHTFVIVAVVVVSVASVEFPSDAPNQMAFFKPMGSVSMPPALGRPDGGAKPAVAATPKPQTERPAVPAEPVAPSQVPDSVTPLDNATASAAEPVTVGGGDGSGTHAGPVGQPDGLPDGVGTGGSPGGFGVGDGRGGEAVPAQENVVHHIGADVAAARVVERVLPVYPVIMVRNKIQATVSVKCIIDRHGRVRDVEIVRSSFPPFNAAVIEALHKWTFSPGTYRGTPVDTYFELTARFGVQ